MRSSGDLMETEGINGESPKSGQANQNQLLKIWRPLIRAANVGDQTAGVITADVDRASRLGAVDLFSLK